MDKATLASLRVCIEWLLDNVDLESPADQFLYSEARHCLVEVRMAQEMKPFWFEGRKFSGWVKTPQMIGKLKKAYPDYLKARKKDDSFDPMFGFDPLYRGITIEEFLK